MSVKIIQPGALTTVQDLGRFGYQESGMQPCGVMDQRSYEINCKYARWQLQW